MRSMRIRELTDADLDAVAELRVHSWRFAYAGLMPEEHLAALSPKRDAQRRREMRAASDGTVTDLVAEDAGGEIAGMAAFGPYRTGATAGDAQLAGDGELYALYVRPELVGGGFGRELFTACVRRLAAGGHPRLRLWVLRENLRARGFYAHMGCAADGAETVCDVAGAQVPEVRYVRPLGERAAQ